MAEPISKIRRVEKTEDDVKQEKMAAIKDQIVTEDAAFLEALELVKALHDSGALDMINSALKAKEDIATTFLNEARKEPATNAINNLMISGKLLTDTKPEQTEKLLEGLANAQAKANESLKDDTTLGLFGLAKAMKDPDVNRALRYGLAFLKGVGQELK
ncbi:DUF1641 domain-containing protein [Listeria booriae]|uniref:DUF1641 domain-containing protein n=1 Tax=Listeria booriae TaxID=1552123 RepID=A0A7X0XLL2_9LIST|nr:DUF1641 domain-containing protein [Listeria booriae]MBC1563311.1 DUF1641 domain-containing protein [Listeria booriae]MBC1574968.1 DUF1641 domain-containing protein [Listeria booriae]MBC1919963.1 DUF1641 domain-containing protein [Listeria booriae]MBC2207650.1 DUF1641 domain-containing protein [Listeria booriae]MBC2239591.1 DUF1641 domain-containing protein [Listeria booriae]